MEKNFSALRKKMVEEQVSFRGINDPRVHKALEKVPRHEFVLAEYQCRAYGDYPLPIGEDQTISQPYMVALMTQCLDISIEDKVLEIGTGSGYQTAVLAELAAKVYTVERLASLAESARMRLARRGYKNIFMTVSDGSVGLDEFAPYEKIMVTAAAEMVPGALVEQLKIGGILVIPVGAGQSQILTKIIKRKNDVEMEQVCSCVFVPLVGRYSNG